MLRVRSSRLLFAAWFSAVAASVVAVAPAAAGDPDLVVVGAGPAGIAAAIEARQAGAEVVVLERRAETRRPGMRASDVWDSRPQSVALEQATVELLRDWGVDVDAPGFDKLEYLELSDGQGGKTVIEFDNTPTKQKWVFRAPTRVTRIRELQRALYARAKALGVQFRFSEAVTELDVKSKQVRLKTSKGQTIRAKRTVVAEGSSAELAAKLGIKTKRGRNADAVAYAIYKTPDMPSSNRFRVRRDVGDAQGQIEIFTMTTNGQTTVGIGYQTPADVPEGEAALTRAFEAAIAKAGINVGRGEFAVPPLLVRPQDRRLESAVTPDGRVSFIGDAALSTTMRTGLGVNSGLWASARFGRMFRVLRSAPGTRRARRAIRRFRSRSRWAARTLFSIARSIKPRGLPGARGKGRWARFARSVDAVFSRTMGRLVFGKSPLRSMVRTFTGAELKRPGVETASGARRQSEPTRQGRNRTARKAGKPATSKAGPSSRRRRLLRSGNATAPLRGRKKKNARRGSRLQRLVGQGQGRAGKRAARSRFQRARQSRGQRKKKARRRFAPKKGKGRRGRAR